jgi:hypothetical protein
LATLRRCVTIYLNNEFLISNAWEYLVTLQVGEIIALVGMGVLLVSNMGRRQARTGRAPGNRTLARMLSWGDFVAFGLILAGLVVMYIQK